MDMGGGVDSGGAGVEYKGGWGVERGMDGFRWGRGGAGEENKRAGGGLNQGEMTSLEHGFKREKKIRTHLDTPTPGEPRPLFHDSNIFNFHFKHNEVAEVSENLSSAPTSADSFSKRNVNVWRTRKLGGSHVTQTGQSQLLPSVEVQELRPLQADNRQLDETEL